MSTPTRLSALPLFAALAALPTAACFANSALLNVMSPPGSNTIAGENPLRGQPLASAPETQEDPTCSPTAVPTDRKTITVEDGKLCLEDRFISVEDNGEGAKTPMPFDYTLSTEKGRTDTIAIEKTSTGIGATCTLANGAPRVHRVYVGKACVPNTVLAEDSAYLALEAAGMNRFELVRFTFAAPAAVAEAPKAAPTADAPRPASSMKIAGVSLTDVTPQQVVRVLEKLGYKVKPSNPAAFSGVASWNDRFVVFSFELAKKGAVVGTVELVRPAKDRKTGERTAGDFIKDASDQSQGLMDGNGMVDAPADTALTAVVNKKEAGSALQLLAKVLKQK